MSRPTLDSNPLGTNTINRKTSPIDLIPVVTKTPETTPLTRPTESPDQNGKAYVPGEPDPDLSSSDSSSNKYNLSKDSNTSKLIKKKSNNKKKHCKHKEHDASDLLSSDSDSS